MERRHLYGATFGIVGVLLATVQLAHAVEQTTVPIAIVVDGVPFALLGLTLTVVGYWLATTETAEDDLIRIGAWAVGGTVLLASVAALTLFSQRVATGSLDRIAYVTVDNLTVGAVAGTVVGLYDARSQRHFRELKRERDRTDAFARKAADLNNYGRALTSATTTEEVGAYCIQGLSSLLDHDETAFVEVTPEGAQIVSSTVPTAKESTVTSIARTAADDDAVVTVRDGEEGPDAVTALTVRLDSTTSRTAVLVAIHDDPTQLSTEDEQLLELLASHASMVLDRIYGTDAVEIAD